ncbi:MAG: hypothetical protein AAF663_05435 [Planctomycetota bacterium]
MKRTRHTTEQIIEKLRLRRPEVRGVSTHGRVHFAVEARDLSLSVDHQHGVCVGAGQWRVSDFLPRQVLPAADYHVDAAPPSDAAQLLGQRIPEMEVPQQILREHKQVGLVARRTLYPWREQIDGGGAVAEPSVLDCDLGNGDAHAV